MWREAGVSGTSAELGRGLRGAKGLQRAKQSLAGLVARGCRQWASGIALSDGPAAADRQAKLLSSFHRS